MSKRKTKQFDVRQQYIDRAASKLNRVISEPFPGVAKHYSPQHGTYLYSVNLSEELMMLVNRAASDIEFRKRLKKIL